MKRLGIILTLAAFVIGIGVWGIMYGGGNAPGGNSGNGGDDGNGGNSAQSYSFTIAGTTGGAVAINNATLPAEATFLFGAGTVVSLKAVPNSGYQFVKWSGDVSAADVHASQILVTVNGNYSLTARFEAIQPVRYTLVVSRNGDGSVISPGRGTYIYAAGTVVDLVVKPASGYEFAGWTGNVDTIADAKATVTTITVNGNYYILANFREHRTCGE